MPSTVIKDYRYDAHRRELVIDFQTGRRYLYFDVTEEEVAAMRRALSKGRYFNAYIRDHYRYRELERT